VYFIFSRNILNLSKSDKYTEIERKNKLVRGEKAVTTLRGNDNKHYKVDLDEVCVV
jgi:hypothetical protein